MDQRTNTTVENPYTAGEIKEILPRQNVLGLRDINGNIYELSEKGSEQYQLIYDGILKALDDDASIECKDGDVFINHFWVIPTCKRCYGT